MGDHVNAASLLAVGFEGVAPSAAVRELIRRGVSGVVLFGRNVESARQVAQLVRDLKREAGGRPLFVAVDQEGGRVARLREAHGFTEFPSMRTLGTTGDATLARGVGAALGRELRAVGIDLDFAPVLDVDTNPANPVIADRSLSREPAVVCELGAALIAGLQSGPGGVAACGKHFPGHGDTHLDSHLALPRLPHDMARLQRVELPPFEAAIRAGVASIMTAHVVFDALEDAADAVPATMSRRVIDGLLRRRLGFGGVAFSDDLEMKAIADHYGVAQAVTRGLLAGVDVFLGCRTAAMAHEAIDALERLIRDDPAAAARAAEARRRIDALHAAYTRPPSDEPDLSPLRCREHLALADLVRRRGDGAAAAGPDPTERLNPERSRRL